MNPVSSLHSPLSTLKMSEQINMEQDEISDTEEGELLQIFETLDGKILEEKNVIMAIPAKSRSEQHKKALLDCNIKLQELKVMKLLDEKNKIMAIDAKSRTQQEKKELLVCNLVNIS